MIGETAAAYIWLAEMCIGLAASVLIIWIGVGRFRRAKTSAGKVLAAGSIAGGVLGFIGLGILASAAVISIKLPTCAPPATAEYCEWRTGLLRSLLVYGIGPVIVLVWLPLVVDWLATRRIARQRSLDKAHIPPSDAPRGEGNGG